MSRSVHTTRRHIEELGCWDYSDEEKRRSELSALRVEMGAKRRTKRCAAADRVQPDEQMVGMDISSIPILVHDDGRYIHYPASPADLQAVMYRLPKGVLDGIVSIELRLEGSKMFDPAEDSGYEPDPYTGRRGVELLPGVHIGSHLGLYNPRRNRIELYGYVSDSDERDAQPWDFYPKLHMLSTFVHEVAHHYDLANRVARGRWRMDRTTTNEVYAESIQHEWMQRYVIPYLLETYPAEVATLDKWLEHHGGVSIPLYMLVGDPRATLRNGLVSIDRTLFGVPSAYEALVEYVVKGEPLTKCRLQFAMGLHYGENYTEALAIIDRVLGDDPGDLDALTQKADIHVHQEQHDLAKPLVDQVLAQDDSSFSAWELLTDCHQANSNWTEVVATTSHVIENFDLNAMERTRIFLDRAEAYMELADYTAMTADIESVEAVEWPQGRMPLFRRRRVDELMNEAERRRQDDDRQA